MRHVRCIGLFTRPRRNTVGEGRPPVSSVWELIDRILDDQARTDRFCAAVSVLLWPVCFVAAVALVVSTDTSWPVRLGGVAAVLVGLAQRVLRRRRR
jgi:hypothetical protein